MRVYTDGSRHFGSQVPRIDAGFVALGHTLTPYSHEADLVYVNDAAHYKQHVADRLLDKLPGRLILNVLDLPFHLGAEFDYEGLDRMLSFADAVTTISRYVQWQVKTRLGRDSSIVYQPVKPIELRPIQVGRYRFLSCGRRGDANKNAAVWVAGLQLLGYTPKDVVLVGNEPGWGEYYGVLDDVNLGRAYNSVDFVLALGTIEGLNLPVLEAMAAGVIPVIHKGLTTREELLPSALFPEYDEVELTPPSVARFIARYANNVDAMTEMRVRLHQHYLTTWKDRVAPVSVAQRILDVYHTL